MRAAIASRRLNPEVVLLGTGDARVFPPRERCLPSSCAAASARNDGQRGGGIARSTCCVAKGATQSRSFCCRLSELSQHIPSPALREGRVRAVGVLTYRLEPHSASSLRAARELPRSQHS